MKPLLLALLLATPVNADPLADLVAGTTSASSEVAGVALVVADTRGIVRAEALGNAVMDPARPMRPDTPVRIASISKLVTALAVMRLVEAGTLRLDTDVSQWLGWQLRNPAHPGAPITLRQLLSHTSGIVDGPGYAFPLGVTLRQSLVPAHWSPAAPGGRFEYANFNYGIIATVMEAATATRFDRLMTRLVLAPLRLDAGYNWSGASDAAIAAAATLYRTGEGETDWHPAGHWVAQIDDLHGIRPSCPVRTATAACNLAAYRPGDNGTLFGPQGGLRISALGLAKIGRLILGLGKVDGTRLLTPASIHTLTTPVWQDSGRTIDDTYHGQMLCYGPGLQCLSGKPGATDQAVPGANWWGHLGEAYGLLSGIWVDRDHGRVLVYALTGTRDDPTKAPHASAFNGIEEQLLLHLAATPPRR